jgi:hypothetical protein
MNWAGGQGFTQSFLGTLQGLTALERAQLEAEDFRERRAREKQFRDITAEELGQVGNLPQTSTGALREATGVMPATEQTATAIPAATSAGPSLRQAAGVQEGLSSVGAQASAMPASTSPVTREDAMLRILERGMAVDPDKAFDMALKGMQLEDVLSTNKQKREFRAWQGGFNTELTNLKNLADMAETNPAEFLTGAKKLGIDIRPVSTGGGKQVFEAYMGGNKVGQYDTLTAAANDGLERYSTNMLIQGASKFATSPEQFVTILSTAERINTERRKLGFDQRRDEREAELQPGKIALNKAQVANLEAETEGKTLAADEKREYNEIRTRILDLLKNPSPESQQELQQLARRAGLLNPKEVLVTKTERNPETGVLESITTNVFTGEVQKSMSEGGVAPPAVLRAAESGTNPQTGKPWTANEISDFERKYPSTPWPGPRPAGASSTRTQLTSAIPTTPSPAARIREARGLPERIPEPPPKEFTRSKGRGGGTITEPNPAYAEWEKQYGERYRAQQRQ